MEIGATGNGGRVTSIAVETIRKANDSARAEGKAMNKLLEQAGEVAKNANHGHERGRIVDIMA